MGVELKLVINNNSELTTKSRRLKSPSPCSDSASKSENSPHNSLGDKLQQIALSDPDALRVLERAVDLILQRTTNEQP